MAKRAIIVNIATSADGFVARPDGNLDWLTSRPAPRGFYGLPKFARSVDAKILGRKTFDVSVELGARFSKKETHYVFSRRPPRDLFLRASNSSRSPSRRLPNAFDRKLARTSG